jgi:flagellar biosynthetic protein FlhB
MYLKLNLQFFAEEKTEKATPKKREDERKKGKVAKSQDVNTALLLFASFLLFLVLSTFMKNKMLDLYVASFTEYINRDINIEAIIQLFQQLLIQFLWITGPVMAIAVLAAIASNLMQIGFLFTAEPLKLDLKKLDPINGAKRIFSIRAIVELLKSLFKIVLVGTVTFIIIGLYKDDILDLALKTPADALSFFERVTITIGISVSLLLVVLAVLDYIYQKYDFEKNIRMSKQDIKDEFKNIEGDPLIKSKLKEKQRQFATSRMMAEVPMADVIITNPTHYAIAVTYDEQERSAPYIVAKGTDITALKIKEIAKANDIITVENKLLARSLFDTVKINETIPEQFYQAIAEILAYVYSIEKQVNK